MAYSILSQPGAESGPCVEPCDHRDCAFSRMMAETPCPYCQEPIGYKRRFVGRVSGEGDDSLAHWACRLDAIEGEQNA